VNPQFIDTYDKADGRDRHVAHGHTARRTGAWLRLVEAVPSMTRAISNGYPVKYEIYSGETGSSDVDYPCSAMRKYS
jgi:hypothetical protein